MRETRAHRHHAAAGGAAGAAPRGSATAAAARDRGRVAAGAVLAALLAAAAAGCASSVDGTQGAQASTPSSGATATATGAPTGTAVSPSPSGDGGAGASAHAQAGGGAACTGTQLHVTTAEGGAAAGHLGMVLVFANTGSTACTLAGYPGAALSGSGGGTLLNAQRTLSGYIGGAQAVNAVTLAAGASASALLEWSDVPTGNGCPGAGAAALLVTPPNTTATTALAPINEVCSGFQIHPVVSGTSGRTGT